MTVDKNGKDVSLEDEVILRGRVIGVLSVRGSCEYTIEIDPEVNGEKKVLVEILSQQIEKVIPKAKSA